MTLTLDIFFKKLSILLGIFEVSTDVTWQKHKKFPSLGSGAQMRVDIRKIQCTTNL